MMPHSSDLDDGTPDSDGKVYALLASADTCLIEQEWEDAAAAYFAALSIAPDCAEASFGLATILSDLGQNEHALPYFAQAAEADSENARYWGELGIALGRAGNAEESLAAFEASLECDPLEEQTFVRIAAAKFQLGRFAEVVAYTNAMPLLQTHHPELLALQASSLLALGRLSEARVSALKGKTRFPNSSLMLAVSAHIENATGVTEGG